MTAIIFGGGPCGLTAAWELARAGVAVTVIEKDNVVGGLCKTTQFGSHRFDLGGHRFISKDRELIDDIGGLLPGELLTQQRRSVIRFHDRTFAYPIDLRNVLSNASVAMNVRFLAGYLSSLARGQRGELKNFDQWINQHFGQALNNYFFKPYTEKLWGIDSSELSADWACQRISLLNAKDAVLKAMRLGKGKSVRTYATNYLYPKQGIGQIFEAMTADIKRLGGEVLLGVHRIKLIMSSDKIRKVVITGQDGEQRELGADDFLSTIPLDHLVGLLGDADAHLPYRSLRFLNVTLTGISDLSPNTWMYTPEKDIIMTRVQEPKRRSPQSAPGNGTSVMLEIPCEYMDTTWSMAQDKLLDRVLADLSKLGFDLHPHVNGVFSTYAKHAYPRYELGYQHKVANLIQKVQCYRNLTSLGRQGLFRYIFMDTAMLMGRQWARNLMDGKGFADITKLGNANTVLEVESAVDTMDSNERMPCR